MLQAPGSSVGQTGDWMIVATQNCKTIGNNKCQNWKTAAEANCGNYDGTPADPTGANSWLTKGGDLNDPRVISLFIVPYQALKGVTGSKVEIPILGFASFYVMGWTGAERRPRTTPAPTPTSRASRTACPTRARCKASSSPASSTSRARSTRTRSAPRTPLTFCRPTLVR